MCDKNCNKCGIAPLCTEKQSLCDTCLYLPLCPIQYTSVVDKCEIYKELPNSIEDLINAYPLCETCKKIWKCPEKSDNYKMEKTSCDSYEPLFKFKEEKPMESAERIEITFKSGETISYGKGEWDDYAYDGKAVIVKQKGAWIGIYNFDHVFCVELKEK